MGDGQLRLANLKRKVREALLVYVRMPDIDAKFRAALRGKWGFSVVHDPGESYGYNSPWLKHTASPEEVTEMEMVMTWLAWLRRQPGEGDLAVRRIIGWATGTPLTTLAWREHRCERTIKTRIDRSLARILREFLSAVVKVEVVDEPPERRERITYFGEKVAMAGAPDSLEPGKVWIDSVGFMFRGRRFDPEGKAIEQAARRRRGR
jgi:hypothetical protein